MKKVLMSLLAVAALYGAHAMAVDTKFLFVNTTKNPVTDGTIVIEGITCRDKKFTITAATDAHILFPDKTADPKLVYPHSPQMLTGDCTRIKAVKSAGAKTWEAKNYPKGMMNYGGHFILKTDVNGELVWEAKPF
jgi:hypothetical protein